MNVSAFEITTCSLMISLSGPMEVMIKKGQEVAEGEVLARQPEETTKFELAKILGVAPQKISDCLSVSLGAKVEKEQPLARWKTFFSSRIFKSPVSGTVKSLSEGILEMTVEEGREIISPVKAKVSQVKPEFLTLEFPGVQLLGLAGKGPDNWGEIEFLNSSQVVNLPAKIAGKILMVQGRIPVALAHKADALEAAGIVGGFLPEELEVVDLAVVVIGEKEGLINPQTWTSLQTYQGKRALISGSQKALKIPQ